MRVKLTNYGQRLDGEKVIGELRELYGMILNEELPLIREEDSKNLRVELLKLTSKFKELSN